MNKTISLTGTMPEFRGLFPGCGAVGKKTIIRSIQSLYLDDCLLILSKLSRHYYKYVNNRVVNGDNIYRKLCFELLDERVIKLIERSENDGEKYNIIFPELSILYLVKLCLKYCDKSGHTLTIDFEPETLHSIGKSLLIANSIMDDQQSRILAVADTQSEAFLINFTKQLIADTHIEFNQKMYCNYFLFNLLFNKYNNEFDISSVFLRKYGVKIEEYFAFLFLLFSQFLIKDGEDADKEMPFFNLHIALQNTKIKFNDDIIENFLINKINYNKIDDDFFNFFSIIENPLVKIHDNIVIPINFKYFILSITDGLYFDIYNFLEEDDQKKYSTFFGKAIEDYFQEIIINISKTAILSFEYKVKKETKETPDAVIVENGAIVMFECKKRQFHTSEFLKNGNKQMYIDRVHEFFYKPLDQIGKRIKDFRNNLYTIDGATTDFIIYPVVICPVAPPIFSGAWDSYNLSEYVIPENLKNDIMIAEPEVIDFEELECIEAYLNANPDKTITDLIKIKRGDEQFHNANWMVILQKNGMALINKRLRTKYQNEISKFKNLLFRKNI